MKRLLAISALLWGTAVAQAASISPAVTQDDLNTFKESQQNKWEAQEELQLKDVEIVRQQISAVDKRVDDQLAQLGQSVDRFGILISMLGVGITALLVLGGFLGYRNAKSEAKEAATDAAKAGTQEWITEQTTALREQINALEQKAAQVHGQMDRHAQDVQAYAAEVTQAISTRQESISKTGTPTPLEMEKSAEVLARRDRELKDINEDSYSFDDWNTRAHAAYTAGKFDDAAYFWHKAAGVANAGAVNVARALFNRGIAQGQLNQNEAAIATYENVLHRFDDAPEAALREQMAKAMINKSYRQGLLNQGEAEIATLDELLHRFSDATELALREQVARALVNKGYRQAELHQNDAAAATCDELLRRFDGATEPVLREQVAMALVNKGNLQAKLGRSDAAILIYDEVLHRFSDATEPGLIQQVARALLNKSVTQGHASQVDDAIATAEELLRRFGEAAEPELRDSATMAMNSAGFNRLLLAKAQQGPRSGVGQQLLQVALENLNKAVTRCTQPNGVVLGNRAYAQCLLGHMAEAEADFAAALRSSVKGGKEIYEATLKDLDIHPLPEDTGMRALIERVWTAYQAESGI